MNKLNCIYKSTIFVEKNDYEKLETGLGKTFIHKHSMKFLA